MGFLDLKHRLATPESRSRLLPTFILNPYLQKMALYYNGARLALVVGYQFLLTAERDVLKDGRVFKREAATGASSRLSRSEDAGLPGRSLHMANLKVFWEDTDKGRFATPRLIFWSRWGVSDLSGTGSSTVPTNSAAGSCR